MPSCAHHSALRCTSTFALIWWDQWFATGDVEVRNWCLFSAATSRQTLKLPFSYIRPYTIGYRGNRKGASGMHAPCMRHLDSQEHTRQHCKVKKSRSLQLDDTCLILNCRGRSLVPLWRLWKLLRAQNPFSRFCVVAFLQRRHSTTLPEATRESVPARLSQRTVLRCFALICWCRDTRDCHLSLSSCNVCAYVTWICRTCSTTCEFQPLTSFGWKADFWGTCHQNTVWLPVTTTQSIHKFCDLWSLLHSSRCLTCLGHVQ